MKKSLIVLLIALSTAGIVFAGGQQGGQAQAGGAPTGNVTLWSMMAQPERATEFDKLARLYEKEHPGTSVAIEIMPWGGTMDKLVAAILAKNAPEITLHGSGWPQVLAGTGGVMEMSPLINELGGTDQFLKGALDLGRYEDGIYSIPLYISPYLNTYRKSMMQKAGITKVPTTWEEYYDFCKKTTDLSINQYGYELSLGDIHSWKTLWAWFQSNGVDFVSRDRSGKWVLDTTPATRAAVAEVYEYMYKLVKDCSSPGTVGYEANDLEAMMRGNNLNSTITTLEIYYYYAPLNDPKVLDDIGYAPIPGRKRNGSPLGWVGMGIQNNGNVSLARDYVKWLYTGDRMIDYYVSYPYNQWPVKRELYANAGYKAKLPAVLQPLLPTQMLDILSSATGLMMSNGPFPYAGEVESRKIFGNPLIAMFNRQITADQAADELFKELAALIE
jgi:ABC-type glycerol-3-phosphate transport system substrate-binding protein